METSTIAGAAPPGRFARRLAIDGIGVYVLLMYGITYYGVTTAAPQMAAQFSMPVSFVFAVITVAFLVTAGLAPYIGRLTDRFGATRLLLGGACMRALAVAAMAIAPEPITFAVALFAVQLLGQATEYDTAFAAAVEIDGEQARSAMSQITLWGGLASTAFWPISMFLLERIGWRPMFLIFAGVILLACAPIAIAIGRVVRRQPVATVAETSPSQPAAAPDRVQRPAPFWLVAAAFAFGGVTYNMPSLMIPVLEGLGLGASAIIVGMLFGPAQTAGRFVDMVVGNRVHPVVVACIATAMVAVALGLLLAGGAASAVAFALLFGAGAGVSYVVRGSVVLALYGRAAYAERLGRLGTVRLIVTAMSPLGLSILLEAGGAVSVVAACAAAAVLSLACFFALSVVTRGR